MYITLTLTILDGTDASSVGKSNFMRYYFKNCKNKHKDILYNDIYT